MSTMLRAFSWILGIASMLLLGAALWSRPWSPPVASDTAFGITPSTQSFGDLAVGTETFVEFLVSNKTGHAVTILGSDAVCYHAACLEVVGLPFSVPIGASSSILVKVHCTGTGDFSKQVILYTDSVAKREVPLTVEGRGFESLSSR